MEASPHDQPPPIPGVEPSLILDTIRDFAVFTVDQTGSVLSWNPGAEILFGWRSAEIVGRSVNRIWTPEDRAADIFGQETRAAREHGQADYLGWRLHKDGRHVFVEGSMRPMRDAAGTLLGFTKVCRDATAQREAERYFEETRTALVAEVERERAQLIELFNRSPSFHAVLYGPNHTVVRTNTQYLNLVGRREEEVLGRTLERALPEVVAQGYIALLDRVFATGEPFVSHANHVQLRRSDHGLEERVVDFVYLPLRDAEDRVTGIFVHGIDLTERMQAEQERKQASEALQESQRRFELTVEGAKLGTFHWDLPAKGSLNWNARLKEMFWFPPEAEVSLDMARTRMHPADRPRVIAAMDRATRGEERYDVEYRVLGPQGEQRWLHVIGEAARGPTGTLDHFSGLAMDVTASRAAAQEREALLDAERAARSEAERASRMKDEFLATLSHELRTPLNAILGWSKLLHEGPNSPEDLDAGLGIIERNARAQKQIIEDLLDMSRIISGKVRLDVRHLDLKPTVEAAIETVQAAATAKGIRLQAVLDPTARPVSGDPHRLQQVFWNLLSNAIKFTPKGGRVQVILERVNSHLEVHVIDTGPGIAPEFLPHVFDRFRQEDASITRQHGGLGLGLAIVKQLVELHGGGVSVRSGGVETGATFTVSLPLTVMHSARADGVPADDHGSGAEAGERRHPQAENLPMAAAPPLPGQRPDLRGLRVVVVDDEPDARALVARLLTDCGAQVSPAGNAEEALSLVERHHPAVLVSDIGMPGMDGYTLIRRVRALPLEQGGQTPAVALTAYARSEDRMRAVVAGFQMHVAKPVEAAELLTMVASLAGRVREE